MPAPDLESLLGRAPVPADPSAVRPLLAGRRVLVTGAGGSIGAELCRHLSSHDPARLVMLDHAETALYDVSLRLTGRALLDSADLVLCDIRDEAALTAAFAANRPDVVFHAAALKHLPILERHPAEAVKTNVWGTRNVLAAARAVGATHVVNVSTDKAADPASVLGWSKRVAEQLTASYGAGAGGSYVSVRFGNVLGSRGSVVETFTRQIRAGLPVTVTDADATRYFMTVDEACELILRAAVIGRPGEALVLDMGRPVRIVDVAEQLMAQLGRRVPVEVTGRRPGEKLDEDLFGTGEPRDIRPEHPLISHVPVPPTRPEELATVPVRGPADQIVAALRALCR
ncbi:MAG: polysaccharide biosynthesis protein [Nocardioidaceae bacterium]